ncbi:MAG: hypothetical protein Q9180_003997 [Flavoplaca navasiana]
MANELLVRYTYIVLQGHAEYNQNLQEDIAQPTEEKVSGPPQDENNLQAEEKRKFMRAECMNLYNRSCMYAMMKDKGKIWRQMKEDLLKNGGQDSRSLATIQISHQRNPAKPTPSPTLSVENFPVYGFKHIRRQHLQSCGSLVVGGD